MRFTINTLGEVIIIIIINVSVKRALFWFQVSMMESLRLLCLLSITENGLLSSSNG